METYQRIELLEEAQEELRAVIEKINQATRGSKVRDTANAYLIPALEVAIDDESEWLGGNSGNIQSLIDDLSDNSDEDTESESDKPEICTPKSVRTLAPATIPPADPETLRLIDAGQPIDALKHYRQFNQCGLKEAIDAVKYIREHLSEF